MGRSVHGLVEYAITLLAQTRGSDAVLTFLSNSAAALMPSGRWRELSDAWQDALRMRTDRALWQRIGKRMISAMNDRAAPAVDICESASINRTATGAAS